MYLLGILVTIVCLFAPGQSINCFRCSSNLTLDCLEKFMHPNPLKEESCSDVFEAKYCIKTTGIYEGQLGTQRFCSNRDLSNRCDFITYEVDKREYKGCVYTCATDGCNTGHSNLRASPMTSFAAVIFFVLSLL